MPGSPVLIRYADDLVVLCHSQEQAEQVKARLARVAGTQGSGLQRGQDAGSSTSPRGSTSWGSTSAATDAQAADQTEQGGHQAAPGTARGRDAHAARRRTRWRSSPGSTRSSGAGRPTTGGWCHPRCSTRWTPTCGSSPTSGPRGSHRNKPKRWIVDRYFGKFNKFRNDRWVFGDRDSGAYLVKFSWTTIVRHVLVKGAASPDDPALAELLGRTARRRSSPRWTATPCACSPGRTGAARSAGTTCSPPTSHPSPPRSGNDGGCRSPARR